MSEELNGKKVAILLTDGFEEVEMTSPRQALQQAGAEAVLVSPKKDKVKAWDHTDWGGEYDVDLPLSSADASEFDALVLPGGVMNPDNMRRLPEVQKFVRAFFEQHKPVSVICHGPWTLIDAGVVKGRKMTSYHTLQQDLINAGAKWVDEEVVVDNGLVSSRNPGDLDAFNAKMLEEIAEGKHARQHA